jgi:hypothetical protein
MNKDDINYKELYEKALDEIKELKERLKKYTAPERNKKFYENHKEDLLLKSKEYRKTHEVKKVDPDMIKKYNKIAYEKRKQKMLKKAENNIESKSN